jgi:hypothetical protein
MLGGERRDDYFGEGDFGRGGGYLGGGGINIIKYGMVSGNIYATYCYERKGFVG